MTLEKPTRFPTITIPESEIVDWYTLGWHYRGPCPVRKDCCVLEWTQSRPPAAPFKADTAVSYSVNEASQKEGANVGAGRT